LLRESKINDRMAELQVGIPAELQIKIFGDSAYKLRSHIRSYYQLVHLKGHVTNAQYKYFKHWNHRMKQTRISIE
jgi:hypothetical protein